MKIDKVFIEKKEDINKIEYEKRTSVIRNPDGSTVFEMNDVIVPKNISGKQEFRNF
jgi:ribonucleoside-diphosphate reductase alpha chain